MGLKIFLYLEILLTRLLLVRAGCLYCNFLYRLPEVQVKLLVAGVTKQIEALNKT